MKKKYYWSMLSVSLLLSLFGTVYYLTHKSFEIYLGTLAAYVIIYGLFNFPGAWLFFRPVDRYFRFREGKLKNSRKSEKELLESAAARIHRLPRYSAIWVLFIGIFYVSLIAFALVYSTALSGESDVFDLNKLTFDLILGFLPSLFFVHAAIPAFIIYFLIYDYVMELKADFHNRFQFNFPAGKKRIGLTLLSAFIMLGLSPISSSL